MHIMFYIAVNDGDLRLILFVRLMAVVFVSMKALCT